MRCRFGGRIFGGAYTWRGVFSEYYGIVGLMYYKDDTQFSAFFLAYSDKRRGETASIQRWILHSVSLLQHRSCQSQNNSPRKDKTYLSWFQNGAFPVIQVILQVSIADAEFEFFQKFLVFHKIQGVKHIKTTLEKKKERKKRKPWSDFQRSCNYYIKQNNYYSGKSVSGIQTILHIKRWPRFFQILLLKCAYGVHTRG